MNKKVSVVLLLILLVFPIAFAKVTIDRKSAITVEEGIAFEVTLTIETDEVIAPFDLYEFVPKGWDIIEWEVEGYSRTDLEYDIKDQVYQGKERTGSHWKLLNTFAGKVTFNYKIISTGAGTNEILTVWTYPGGYNSEITTMSVLPAGAIPPHCGNGVCDVGETEDICPTDCAVVTVPTIIKPSFQFPSVSFDINADITWIVIAIILSGFTFGGFMIYLKAKRYFVEAAVEREKGKTRTKVMPNEHVAIEDLRAFIKLGLRRGYTLRQMANALRGARINTIPFKQVAKEEIMKEMNRKAILKRKELTTDDKYMRRLNEAAHEKRPI